MKPKEIKTIAEHLPTIRAGRSSNLPQAHIANPGELIPDLMSLGTMPSRIGSVDDEKAAMRIAAMDLAGLPTDLVKQTIRRFRLGKLGDGHWRPTTAEIRKAVEAELEADARIAQARRDEAEQLQARAARRAQADRLSPESRARVQAMVEEFKAALPDAENLPRWHRPRNAADAARMREAAQAELDAGAVAKRGPLTVSPELAAMLAGEAPIGEGKGGAHQVGGEHGR